MVINESALFQRIYSIPLLLLFRKDNLDESVRVREVHPNLPKLELRCVRQKEISPISIDNSNTHLVLSNTSGYGCLDFLEENETFRKKHSSLSDMSTLLGKISSDDLDKQKITVRDNIKRHSTIGSVEEPLTSRMISRLKQIAIGKSLPEYKNYINKVPFESRSGDDPKTPECDTRLTKREFDQLYREWRVKLHKFENETVSNVSTRFNSPEEIEFDQDKYLYKLEKIEI